ncbi:pyrroline-5-carboxylate reductase [Sphingorhabdus sp. IMCC26285]|uniref:Pyrroline-5-carboxylate reductase n=1 Tax=Sphingorhabdus profundilacus TaxID=2509718 RepID=A0A6I4M9H5_9SPHN|nr:pyrroline-5-carboxylate reductase [Sphingorhabdus profundilacus]
MDGVPEISSHILIVGCGNMGGAMLRGWVASGRSPKHFTVIDPVAQDLPSGVRHVASADALDESFDTVLLGIKPQILDSLAPAIRARIAPNALVLSILAGAMTSALAALFPDTHIVRLMPNLSAALGLSPLGLFSAALSSAERDAVDALVAPLGTPVWIDDEAQMDAVTALAGSGPAFVYRFIDALAQGGVAAGLPAETSARLALATVAGAARLAAVSDESPAALAMRVTSPGGTTAAGLAVLDAGDGLRNLVEATLKAARDRGAQLAKGDKT